MLRGFSYSLCLGLTLWFPFAADAALVPFTEHFAADASRWRDTSGTTELSWVAAGGPDGSSYVFENFNFVSTTPGATPALFRAHDAFDSSDDAFVGDWIADGVTVFSAFVRHDAPLPLTFFTRFASSANFPGAVGLNFAPVPPNTWTEIAVGIFAGNPQFIFEGTDFATVFSNVGNLQIGMLVPDALVGADVTVAFDLDQPAIVPEPATAALGLLAAAILLAARRRTAATGGRR